MPLKLVLGPANSAKAGEVLDAYAAATRDGALLVVPTAADARRYALEVSRRGVITGASVTTFSGLARAIGGAAGLSATVASPTQRDRLVRGACAAATGALERVAAGAGFARAAAALIAELERSLVTPQRFAQAMRAWAGDDPVRRAYADAVSGVYLRYAQALERHGLLDPDLFAWRALDALRADPPAWRSRPVFMYGFDDLHPLQRDAVETLARVAGAPVTVSLTWEAGRAAFAARAEVVAELRAQADEVVELPALAEHYAPAARAALHALERRLFEPARDDAERVQAGDAIVLLEAGGERAEAELACACVLEELRGGVRPEEIAVVHRSPARAGPLLRRVLGGAGVPLAGDSTIPFEHTTLGRGVCALARWALAQEAPAADLVRYLRTPGLPLGADEVDRLELEIRRRGLRTAREAERLLHGALIELDALRRAGDPADELVAQATRLLALPARGRGAVLAGDGELDALALRTLADTVAELRAIGERPRGDELVELLSALAVQTRASPRADAVLLADPLAVRARRFRVVVVCGLVEGEFPLAAAPDPFLPDELRRELAIASGLRLPARGDRLDGERYLLYACAARPTDRLYLSYRSSDEDGNLALPSPFIADVADVLEPGWIERRRRRLLADVTWSVHEAPTERELARARALAARPAGARPAGAAVHQLDEGALALARHREVVSAGALECFGDCPVKWLVERELQPPPFGPEPYPLARGSYLHEVLERVIGELGAAVTPETLARAQEILTEVLAQLPAPAALGRSDGVRAAALRSIEADLRRYLGVEAAGGCEWRPERLELRFGFDDEDSLPALELADGVRVRGMIDRVDVEPGGRRAIVRDYKSSASTSHPRARWILDRRVQLALYMLVVRDLLELRPVAGFYQPLGGREPRPRGVYVAGAPVPATAAEKDCLEQEELDEALAQAAALAVELASTLRSGVLAPAPETCSRTGCAYPAICRSG